MVAKKGSFGYIQAKKRKNMLMALTMVLCGGVIFVAGLLLNDMSQRNIFTVIAVLFALPFAKFTVGTIVIFPYKSVARERYELARKGVPNGVELYTDLVITSPEKVMNLDFVAVGRGRVVGLVGKPGQDIAYIRKYLTDGVHNWGNGYKVKIVDSEKLFLRELEETSLRPQPEGEAGKEEEERVRSYLLSLIV